MKKVLVMIVALLLAAAWGGAEAQQADVQLKDVVVTATKTEKDPKDVTQSVTVITAEEIKRSSATSVAEAVQTAAGVSVVRQGPRGSLDSLSIRGASYSQVLVLLDGVRLNSPRDSGADLSSIPVALEDIERIEIVRGAASALYGADAVGGVVNIITKKPETSITRTGGAVGSHGYDLIRVEMSGRRGAGYYSVHGNRETSDGYRMNSGLEQWTSGGKVGYSITEATTFEVSANYLSKDLGAPGSLLYYESPNAWQQERTATLSSSLASKLGGGVDIKVSAARTENLLRFQDPDSHVVTTPTFTYLVPPISSQHKSVSTGGELQLNWLAADWSMFTAGYETRKEQLDSTDSGVHQTTNEAWYLQDEINAGRSLILVIGQRHDKHSVYEAQDSTRASARYLLGEGTMVRLSYGESFRAPTFNDLYWSDPTAIGNPNLKPERGVEYETGIEQALGAGSWLKVSGFRRKVKELINWDWMVFPMQPENIGRADIKGAEGEVMLRAADDFSFALTYTYLKAIDETTKDKIYSTLYPKNQFGGHITVAVDKDVSITIEGRSVENYVKPDEPKWHYSVYDAKISQRIGRKNGPKGEVYFAMTNIFDREYENARGYPMPPKEIRGGVMLPF